MQRIFRYILPLLLAWTVLFTNAQTIREQYKAKKKDTIYGIARKFGVTIEELTLANPQMQAADYQLKKGEVVNIPEPVANASVGMDNTASLFRTPAATLRVGVILPLNDQNADGRRMVEYYRGFLMACDSLRREGYSIDIHAWNVGQADDVRTVLLEPSAAQCDLIVGPYYTNQIAPLADFCQRNRIRLAVPFASSFGEVERFPQIFKMAQTAALQNMMAVSAFLDRFPQHHPVFIDCHDADSQKGAFTAALRSKLDEKGVSYNLTSLQSSDDQFARAFSKTAHNVVILNSASQQQLQTVVQRMEKLTANVQGLYISLYGYAEWIGYEAALKPAFHKYDTYIPTAYYFNAYGDRTKGFARSYEQWFKTDMQRLLPRYALTGYDHAQYLLRGIRQFGHNFIGTRQQSTLSTPIQTPLRFKRATATGGLMNETFMLIHYRQDKAVDMIHY